MPGVIVHEVETCPHATGVLSLPTYPSDLANAPRRITGSLYFSDERDALEHIEKLLDEQGAGPEIGEDDGITVHRRGFVVTPAQAVIWSGAQPEIDRRNES